MSTLAEKAADSPKETPAGESATAEYWLDRIKVRKSDLEKRHQQIQELRAYAEGSKHDDGAGGLVRTNLIYVNQATIVPHTYAKNPEIAVSPSEAVDPSRYKLIKNFSHTLEIVLQRMFVLDAQLKKRARSNLYSIHTNGEGWLKMIYQRDWGEDPIVKSRIQDSQDNIAQLEQLVSRIKNPEKLAEAERSREELKHLINALEKQVEIVAAEGLVIDRVRTEDITILDGALFDFDYYTQASAIAQDIWMSTDEWERVFGKPIPSQGGPTLYGKPMKPGEDPQSVATKTGKEDGKQQYIRVHEIWNKDTNTVLTVSEGAKDYSRDPYTPQRTSERWYPFFRWGWNFLDSSIDALPDAALQKELQDEYNTTRTNYADHRKDSVPVRLVRGSGSLTQEDVDNIQKRKTNQIIVVQGSPGTPINQDIATFENVPVDPAVYDVTPIRSDMELVAGRGDAAAGSIQQAKTATEAEILQQGLMSRSEFRRDIVEDGIQEMAVAAAEILLQELTPAHVQQLAGPEAVWPQMSKWEIFNLVQIEIRAGSTARPNKIKELEQWKELLPLLKESVMQIYELRAAGQFDLAESIVKMLKLTLERFDERIDIEEFVGGGDGEEGDPQAQFQQQAMQKVQQLEEQLAQVTEELTAAQQQAEQSKAEELALKAKEIDDRQQERQVQQVTRDQDRQAEQQTKEALEREKMDREDARAEKQRQHDLAMKQTDDIIQQLQAELEQARAETAEPGDDDTGDELGEAIQRQMMALEERLARMEAEREKNINAVLQYLAGPKTDDRLKQTITQIGSAPSEPTDEGAP